MKEFLILSLVIVSFLCGIFLFNFSPSVQTIAQKITRSNAQIANNWQYCTITRVYVDNPPSNRLDKFTGNVQVHYYVYSFDRTTMKESYVGSETFSHELNYQEFLQESGLQNNLRSQESASSKAADLALAKAINKLGNQGWEIVGKSFANMNFETLNKNSDYKNALFFRKLVSQNQSITER